MDKSFLLTILSKYYLNGLIERVKLVVENKTVAIKAVSNNKDMVAIVNSPFEMDDKTINIFDTSQLLKLLGVTQGLLNLSIVEESTIPIQLIIDDSNYNLEFRLADGAVIPKAPKIEEPTYDFDFPIDQELIDKFNKARKALPSDEVDVVIKAFTHKKGNYVEFIIGNKEKHSNKVKFQHPIIYPLSTDSDKGRFSADNIKEIFACNKDVAVGKAYFSGEGLIKFEFENEAKQVSKYFLIAKS